MAGEYSKRMLNNPELLKREILSQKKYWFSKRGYALFAVIFFLAIVAGIYLGALGFVIGIIILVLAWRSKTSFKRDIKKGNWRIEEATLQPKSKRQEKGIVYTDLSQSADLVYTDFRYANGRILSGNCRIEDFIDGLDFYTVIVGDKKIVYTWPTYR